MPSLGNLKDRVEASFLPINGSDSGVATGEGYAPKFIFAQRAQRLGPRRGDRPFRRRCSCRPASAWGKHTLDTSIADDAAKLRAVLQKPQRRSKYKSTVLNFDSDRTIVQINPLNFAWDWADPYEEDVGWDQSYRYLRDRFQDVQDSLFKLVETQRRKIAERAVQLMREGKASMPLDFPDPLERYKNAFSQLLGPKRLVELDVRNQQIIYEHDGERLLLGTLSSGEREVTNIVFDFILRNPSDCIVLFDEPELHLHPELSYKLLQTLSSIGKNNQFLFCTHSPEIITASIDNSVIFLTPKKPDRTNQALVVSRDDATHHALNLLGQSIGIISLGKKLLLIEGDEASLDKQTYGAILKNEFPELVLVPVGGKSTIRSFDEIRQSVLNRTIWGVEFFMLCDRDAVYGIGPRGVDAHLSERLKVLPRYHLENYFLDEQVIAGIFKEMEADEGCWLRDPVQVAKALRLLAGQSIPLAVALKTAAIARETVGNVDVMPKSISQDTTLDALLLGLRERVNREHSRIAGDLEFNGIEAVARAEHAKLTKAVADIRSDAWKRDIPGRVVLNRFANLAKLNVGRLKTLYVRHAQAMDPDPFSELRDIFRGFRDIGRSMAPEVEAPPTPGLTADNRAVVNTA
jgi:hypothetical protein